MAARRKRSHCLRGRGAAERAEALCDSCSRQKLKNAAAETSSSNRAPACTHRRANDFEIRGNPAAQKQKYKLFPRIVPKAASRYRSSVKISNNTTVVNQVKLMLRVASRSARSGSGMAGLWIFVRGERRFIMASSFDNSQSMLLTFRVRAFEATSTGAN